jgi:endoglucanase
MDSHHARRRRTLLPLLAAALASPAAAQSPDELETWLEELSEAPGPSGFEEPAAQVFGRFLRTLVDEVRRDNLGGVLGIRHGPEGGPRLLLDAHLDEIGFLVKRVDDAGFVRFSLLGWNTPHQLLDRRVVIHTRKGPVHGVIQTRPDPPRDAVVSREDMFIDVGSSSKAFTEETLGVRPGDAITHESTFRRLGDSKFLLGKAWDDRSGLAVVLGAMRATHGKDLPCTLLASGSVQEEVTLAGAQVLAALAKPDVAITLDIDETRDQPGADPDYANAALGKGVVVILHTKEMVPQVRLRDWVLDLAREFSIPVQPMVEEGGGTDAGPIHKHGIGVPTLDLVIPQRYYHAANGVIHRDDVEAAIRLVAAIAQRMDRAAFEEIRPPEIR